MIRLSTYMSLRRNQIDNFAQQLEEDFNKVGFYSKIRDLPSKEEAITQILLLEASLHNQNTDQYTVANAVKKSFKAATGVALP